MASLKLSASPSCTAASQAWGPRRVRAGSKKVAWSLASTASWGSP
jgi:hypothetical protein